MKKVEDLSGIFKALGDPTRLSIVLLLYKHRGALCVNALTNMLSITQSAVSQHLRVLKDIGLIRGSRIGSHVHYSIDKEVADKYKALFNETFDDALGS
jgi:DNA-binding transcriptional ArsR family regulator